MTLHSAVCRRAGPTSHACRSSGVDTIFPVAKAKSLLISGGKAPLASHENNRWQFHPAARSSSNSISCPAAEDAFAQKVRVGHPRDAFDDEPQKIVVGIGVSHLRS